MDVANISEYGAKRNQESAAAENFAAVSRAAQVAKQNEIPVYVPGGSWYVDSPVLIPANVSLRMDGLFVGAGMIIGDEDTVSFNQSYEGLAVTRKGLWSDNAAGIHFRNLSTCDISVRRAMGFALGVLCEAGGVSKARSWMYNTIRLGAIIDNQTGVILRSTMTGSSPNQNTFIGGRIGIWSGDAQKFVRGIAFEAEDGAYTSHNNNQFLNVSIEIGRNPGSLPLDLQCGYYNRFSGRHESHTTLSVKEGSKANWNEIEWQYAQSDGTSTTGQSLVSNSKQRCRAAGR